MRSWDMGKGGVTLQWFGIRIGCAGSQEGLEERFKYSTEKIMPQFKRDATWTTHWFVPSF